MKFHAKVYKVGKGKNSQPAYLAVIKRYFIEKLKLREGDGILVKLGKEKFPSVIRKHGSRKFVYAFTIPHRIGKRLKLKTKLSFYLISKNIQPPHTDQHKKGYVNLLKIVPERTVMGKRIYVFKWFNNKLLFWIYSRGNRPFILPQFVPLERNGFALMELFGVFLCEGLKARRGNKHLSRLSFSNTEKEQIEWFTNAMKFLLGIKNDEWKVQILHSKTNDDTKMMLKKYWSQVGFTINNISIIRNETVSAEYGVCVMNINNSTLAEVFYHLMEYCRSIALDSKENCIKIFRGFSRGDMGVTSKSITFDSMNKEDVLLFKEVCKRLGIRTNKLTFFRSKKGWWNTTITGRENFKRILLIDGIKHRKRRRKVIELFLNNKKDVLYKYLKAIDNGFKTSRDVAKTLNLSIITTRFYLSKLRKEGYLVGKVRDKGKIYYSLTQKGLDKLKFYRMLETR